MFAIKVYACYHVFLFTIYEYLMLMLMKKRIEQSKPCARSYIFAFIVVNARVLWFCLNIRTKGFKCHKNQRTF